MKACSVTSIRPGRTRSVARGCGTAAAQTAAPIGVTKPARPVPGEGAPLTSFRRELNAAAIRGAMVRSGTVGNSTHDCLGMSGRRSRHAWI
jgi:hypothetical protein